MTLFVTRIESSLEFYFATHHIQGQYRGKWFTFLGHELGRNIIVREGELARESEMARAKRIDF
jgi:hypothetical protein